MTTINPLPLAGEGRVRASSKCCIAPRPQAPRTPSPRPSPASREGARRDPALAHADFVHLRVHSAYSLSAGAIKVKQLVALCKQHRMPAVAITDTGNLFGALEFAQACIDAGVQPVIGCELGLRRHDGEPRSGRPALPPEPDRIALLVQSAEATPISQRSSAAPISRRRA